jgi:putative membrane protein
MISIKQLVTIERICLIGHIAAMAFGLAGLILVIPNAEFILSLSKFGQDVFQVSMANGGVGYIILGAAAMAIYAYRVLGVRQWLGFMLPALVLSLSSELLGTSTGFPFGHYQYLSGLGYKIAGLVPFTIPLSWFYLGFSAYLLARAGLENTRIAPWIQQVVAIAIGSILLTAWDLVLDPAMTQTAVPFWQFQEVGEFFGMPYRNLSGWIGTGVVFMTVAALIWEKKPLNVQRSQLLVPLTVYLVNFAFGAVITVTSLDSRFLIPTALGVLVGVIPAIGLWLMAAPTSNSEAISNSDGVTPENSENLVVHQVKMLAK